MCGIVGMVGREPVTPRMVDALRRMEYRGYDSAGVATLEEGRLTRRRAEGKLLNLERCLARQPLEGKIGIGHTRWATHGRARPDPSTAPLVEQARKATWRGRSIDIGSSSAIAPLG